MTTASQGLDLQLGVEMREAIKSLQDFQKEALKALKGAEEGAKKSADGMGKAFTAFKGVAVAALAALSVKQVTDFFAAGIEGAIAEEAALKRLETAMELTGEASTEALKGFKDFANEMENSTKFSDDLVLNQLALAKSFGVSNAEAEKLVRAAADLASATGKDLETATKELGKTFAGTTGKLKDQVPALRELTEEQLKSGKALDVILDRFGGSAGKEIETFGGAILQAGNAFEDLQKAFGKIIIENPAVVAAVQLVRETLNLLTETAEDSREGISGFVTFMAKAFAVGFSGAVEAIGFFARALQGVVVTANLAFDGLVVVVAGGTKKVAELAGEAVDSILGVVEDLAKAAEETPGLAKVFGLAGFDVGEISGSIGGLRQTIKDGVKEVTDGADTAMEASFESTAGVVETFESFNRGFSDFSGKVEGAAQKVFDADYKVGESAKKAAEGRKALTRETTENAKEVAKLADEAAKFAAKVTEANLSEAGKLAAERDKQLKEIETYEKKKVIAAEQAAALRVEVENTYISKLTELEDKQLEESAKKAAKASDERRKDLEKQAEDARKAVEYAAQNPISVIVKGIFDGQSISGGQAAGIGVGITSAMLEGAAGANQLLSQGAGAIADMIVPGIGGAVGTLVSQLAKGPEENKKMIREFVGALPELITGIAESAPAIVEALVDSLINEGGIIKIAVALARALAGEAIFKAIGKQLGIDLADSFNAENVGRVLKEALAVGASVIGDTISVGADKFASGAANALSAFSDGLQAFGEGIREFFAVEMPEFFSAAFADGYSQLQAAFAEGSTAIVSGFIDGANAYREFVVDTFYNVIDAFTESIGMLFETPPWVQELIDFLGGLSFGGSGDGDNSTGGFEETTGVNIPGVAFAKGGDFIVPPGFPNDTFPMRVQTGERVQVTPANQVAAGAGGDAAMLGALLRIAQLLEGRQVVDAQISIDGKAIQRQILELDRRHARVSA